MSQMTRTGSGLANRSMKQPRLVRRIGEHDPARQNVERRPLALHGTVPAAAFEVRAHQVGGQAGVADGGTHVVVAENQPRTEPFVPVQWRGFAQAREVGKRIRNGTVGQQLGDLSQVAAFLDSSEHGTVTRMLRSLHGQ